MPANSTPPARKRPKPVKARRITLFDDGYYSYSHSKVSEERKKFFALPASKAAKEAMIEQVQRILVNSETYQEAARAALTSLGILPERRKRK